MNDDFLHEAIRSDASEDDGGIRASSCDDERFFKICTSHLSSVCSIQLKSFVECEAKALEQFFASSFLAVDSGDFFDPANPPVAVLLYNCAVVVRHCYIIHGRYLFLS